MKIYVSESAVQLKVISKQEALDRGMFGPVYHGSPRMDKILKEGFDLKHVVPVSNTRHRLAYVLDYSDLESPTQGPEHGYPFGEYYPGVGIPAPIHHLGFGIYFTTVKNIGKKFNNNSVKNLKEFYLDVPRLETINFASARRMMNWWHNNGYDVDPNVIENNDHREWVRATGKLTKTLRNLYDAVWFKGKGMRTLLDGDQVVVFDPRRIYLIDPSLSQGLEVGAKVTHTQSLSSIDEYLKWQPDYPVYAMPYVDFVNSGDIHKSVYGKHLPLKENWTAIVRAKPDRTEPSLLKSIPPPNMWGIITDVKENKISGEKMISVKWQKGGVMYNYNENELQPVVK